VDEAPWMWLATEGPLAGLKVQHGRVVGTLGEEKGVVHQHDATGPRQVGEQGWGIGARRGPEPGGGAAWDGGSATEKGLL
jgi:hypothetical protein